MTDDIERRLADATRRLERLEDAVDRLAARLEGPPAGGTVEGASIAARPGRGPGEAAAFVEPLEIQAPQGSASRPSAARAPKRDWEQIVGGHALGWAAVVVLLFAAAFFVRYAFENFFIGPQGRVALGVLAGVTLVVAGARYHAKSWRAFSQMLTAGGVLLLYLSTYGACGFYHLLDTRAAGVFLAVLVVESAMLALEYDAMSIALMAIIGGLLTPILMRSDRDQYKQLFFYLLALNAGVAALRMRRAWPALGTIAFLGAELIYWLWSSVNYHPEKRAWALGFQAALAALYIGHDWWTARRRPAMLTREDSWRLVFVAVIVFGIFYDLLVRDYEPWMGSMAMAAALLFAVMTRGLIAATGNGALIAGVCLALSAGFLALAMPLQSRGPWNAIGWAVEAGVLAWFGLRLRRPMFRILALPLAILAMDSILTDPRGRLEFRHHALPRVRWPVLNRFTLTALATSGSLLASIGFSRKLLARAGVLERWAFGACFVISLLLTGHFVSEDLYRGWARSDDDRFAQMLVSGWWSFYAAALLAGGFYARGAVIRWTALGIFGVTLVKVFFVDMADLNELYRVGTFLLLAVLLGLAAWAYQRYGAKDKGIESAKG